jgi:hypothetical protein
MKRLFKIVGTLILVAVLCMAAVIGYVEYSGWRDQRDLNALVAALPPGTPFSVATERLGQPTRVIADPQELSAYRSNWGKKDIPGPKMNFFVYHHHRLGALYWIWVFTDAESKTIQRAEWSGM